MLQASRCGDCDQLQAILRSGETGGGTWHRQLLAESLLAAATWDHAAAVRQLLQANADPCGAADPAGATALHLAVRRGHAEVAELLLLTLPSPREFDPLRSRPRLLDARDADGVTPLAESCQAGRPELAELLLRAGADPNLACGPMGWGPLHWAACGGDRELARLLLRADANPAAADARGRTAATVAEDFGHRQLAMELREAERRRFRPEPDVVVANLPEQPLIQLQPLPSRGESNPQSTFEPVPQSLYSLAQSAPGRQPLSRHQLLAAAEQPLQWQPLSRHQPQPATEPQPQFQSLSRHQSQTTAEQPMQRQALSRHQPQPATESQPQLQLLSRHQLPAAADPPPQFQQPRIPSVEAASLSLATESTAFSLSQSHPTVAFRAFTAAAQPRRFSDTPEPTAAGPPPESPTSRWRSSSCAASGPPEARFGRPDAYPMSARPRGLCLVVSNERHSDPARLSDRPGSQRDVERIDQLFSRRLGFAVQVETNLTGRRMRDVARAAAALDHRPADALVCFLLGHGAASGGLYGTDGELVPLAELAAAFDVVGCPGLAGKPKIFFVQACRGAGEVVAAATRLAPDGPQGAAQPPLISPEGADYLYGFACCEERVAYRCPDSGSVYVQTLCEEIEQRMAGGGGCGLGCVDLEEALQVTARRISSASLHAVGEGLQGHRRVYMVPEVRSTLRFKLLLPEG